MATFDMDKAHDFVRLTKRMEDLEEEIDAVRRERKVVHDGLLREFEKTGMQNVGIGGRTVYLRREIRAYKAKGVETEAVLAGLRAAGLGDYVKGTYSAQSLSSLYRELDEKGEDPPPELDGLVTKAELFDVRAPKS